MLLNVGRHALTVGSHEQFMESHRRLHSRALAARCTDRRPPRVRRGLRHSPTYAEACSRHDDSAFQRLIVRPRPPEHQDPPHLLHGGGTGMRAHTVAEFLATRAIGTGKPDFDQSVRRERPFDLSQHTLRRAGLPDLHDRFQRMCAGLQESPLTGRKVDRHLQNGSPSDGSASTDAQQMPAALWRFLRKRLEAPPGFEPGIEVLQTSALPLGDGAGRNLGALVRESPAVS